MDIQAEKANIIEQLKLINDENIIRAVKNMLEYAKIKDYEKPEIQEAHQKLVMERFDKVRKEPERLLDWNEAKKLLKG